MCTRAWWCNSRDRAAAPGPVRLHKVLGDSQSWVVLSGKGEEGARRTHLFLGGSAGQAWRLWLERASRSQGLCLPSARQPWGLGGVGGCPHVPTCHRGSRERSSDCRLGREFCPSARPGDWPTLRFCAGPSGALKSTAAEPRRQRRGLRPGGPSPSTSERCRGRGLVPSSPASTLLPTPWMGSEGPSPVGAVGRASRRSGTDAGQQGRESPLDAQLAWREGGGRAPR